MARFELVLDALGADWVVRVPCRDRLAYQVLAAENRDLRIERTAEGDAVVRPPAFLRTGYQNGILLGQIADWAARDGRGVCFDSSAGFDLPNGANRSPDVSWLSLTRLHSLTPEQRDGFLPLCPDLTVELRGRNDALLELQEKLEEYVSNGATLGWLIDPTEKRVHVYRRGSSPEILAEPASLSGEPDFPGLTVDLSLIWNPEV